MNPQKSDVQGERETAITNGDLGGLCWSAVTLRSEFESESPERHNKTWFL